MPPGFRPARGPFAWLMRRNGIAALTMPWRRVYILEEWQHYQPVIEHERVHLEQIERHGPVGFTILYLWWLARYGYERNPFEVEAYARAPV